MTLANVQRKIVSQRVGFEKMVFFFMKNRFFRERGQTLVKRCSANLNTGPAVGMFVQLTTASFKAPCAHRDDQSIVGNEVTVLHFHIWLIPLNPRTVCAK